MKLEKQATPAFRKICNSLKDLAQDLIDHGRLEESVPILDMITDINTGVLEKDETIQEMSAEIVQSLASEKNLHRLSHEYSTNEQDKQTVAASILSRLGDTALTHLLDMLRDHDDSNERVRIMQLIIGIGPAAISIVRDRIDRKEPWYYLRNLAYMLGRIGDEASAYYFRPLLSHEDNRVRLEALKSVYRTGGKERGPLLLSILPDVDDAFALNIIETLGNAKCMDAVPGLLDMLKNCPLVGSTVRADLEETICIALGAIGSPEAVPALSEIAGTKYFFRIRSYPDKVKNAASRAVAAIRKEHPEAGKGKFPIL
jgi:HEAT repeat protein